MATPWLPIASTAARMLSGLFGYGGAKRQARMQGLQSDIQDNFVRSNLLTSAAQGYGDALASSARAGGHSSGAFQSGFNNLAADLRMAQFNRSQRMAQISSQLGAARTSLLTDGASALFTGISNYKQKKQGRKMLSLMEQMSGTPQTSSPGPTQTSKFLNPDWVASMSSFGGFL
jgi:hypothetical protein